MGAFFAVALTVKLAALGAGFGRPVSNLIISCANPANSAVATVVRGCTTMSHPAAISRRCSLNISRSRRRMRFRFTAFPSAFLMLHPNRLTASPLGRTNSVNSRLLRRRPSRYTASYSARRTSRVSRGRSSRRGSDAREGVAPFLAACGKDFPSTLGLHAFAESVFLVAAPHVRLISAFRQRKSPLIFSARPPTRPLRVRGTHSASNLYRLWHARAIRPRKHPHETSSLDDHCHHGQGIAHPSAPPDVTCRPPCFVNQMK